MHFAFLSVHVLQLTKCTQDAQKAFSLPLTLTPTYAAARPSVCALTIHVCWKHLPSSVVAVPVSCRWAVTCRHLRGIPLLRDVSRAALEQLEKFAYCAVFTSVALHHSSSPALNLFTEMMFHANLNNLTAVVFLVAAAKCVSHFELCWLLFVYHLSKCICFLIKLFAFLKCLM